MIKIVRNSCPHAIRKPLSGKLILLTLLVLMQSVSFGQTTKKLKAPTLTRIEFLFDASQSMYGQWQSGAKIDIAKSLMKKVLDSLRYVDNLELALRVYGHQKPYPPQDCDDSRLEVPFSKGNISTIQEVLKNLIPKGTTPIAKSWNFVAMISRRVPHGISSFLSPMESKNVVAILVRSPQLCKRKESSSNLL